MGLENPGGGCSDRRAVVDGRRRGSELDGAIRRDSCMSVALLLRAQMTGHGAGYGRMLRIRAGPMQCAALLDAHEAIRSR